MKNVFQIWHDNNGILPFAVRRNSWSEKYYAVVVRVSIINYPYGEALGYLVVDNEYKKELNFNSSWRDTGVINCAGCYQWELLKDVEIHEKDIIDFFEHLEPRKTRKVKKAEIYGLESKFDFGKFKGDKISKVIKKDPIYVKWCIMNVGKFSLDAEAIKELEDDTDDKIPSELSIKNTQKHQTRL